ncbi:hypothetical protein M569_07457 [Genlisea aurea]|uniref:Uncharacterized protein n=1 Tax=Genlisea aurea TaxID=192259 RepID=S8CR05_9LAMI|nr:hypothetical protein M569_07457 [Genlisea aurea]
MDLDDGETPQPLYAKADVCQQLLTRYLRSSAVQHRHLCAAAAATRSIIEESSLSLTPVSYFAAIITSIENSNSLDSHAIGALTSLLCIVLPLVGRGEINPDKAKDAVEVLMRKVEGCGGNLGTSGVRAAVQSVGGLIAEFYNLNEWDSVSPGFEWLVKLSLDRRPKVRKCAQECLFTIFKSFKSSSLFKRAGRLVYSMIKDRLPAVSKVINSKIVGETERMLPEHQDVVHLLGLMKHAIPFLSPKFQMRMLPRLSKMFSYNIPVVITQVSDIMLSVLKTSGADIILSNSEEIFQTLVSYMSSGKGNSVDNIFPAATLSKTALAKLHDGHMKEWTTYFPMVTGSLACHLCSDTEVAFKTSNILREIIDDHFDEEMLLKIENRLEDRPTEDAEFKIIQATCDTFYNVLINSSQLPSESLLDVISFLFRKLGRTSGVFMEPIILKLAASMNITADAEKTMHLQECFGYAVSAMGPEKLLALLPISFSINDLSTKNIWLIPILEKNVSGSSLRFFLEHIVPLAKSFDKGSRKEWAR